MSLLCDHHFDQQTLKLQQALLWALQGVRSFYFYLSFSFLYVFVSGIFMLCHFTIDNNQMGPYPFFCANCSTINPTCVHLQTLIIQCCFTLISPEGFMYKNLGYPGLLGQVITRVQHIYRSVCFLCSCCTSKQNKKALRITTVHE